MTTITRHPLLSDLERRRDATKADAAALLRAAKAAGRETLNPDEDQRFKTMTETLRLLEDRIRDLRDDDARAGDHNAILRGAGKHRAVSSAGMLAPLGYHQEQLRHAFDQVNRGETAVLTMERRDPGYVSASPLVPPYLMGLPVFPRHESRLLNRLPGLAIDVPQVAYIEVVSTTGTAAVVPEGQPKPELLMPTDSKVATARTIAAHVGISWQAYSGDFPAFVTSVQTELLRCVCDEENAQLYGGTGEANGQVNGLTTNPNVLTFDASTVTTTPGPWDALEHAIETLRSGPALAEPDLILMHPSTWSAVRRQVNTYGSYYVAADPSSEEVNQAWGIDVLVSTAFTAGTAVLLDTSIYGRVVVREPLITRIGYSGTDFTSNVVRYLGEERITQTIERPQAICVVSKLPIAAAADVKAPAKK
jgi:hypothetical protein